MTKFMNALLLVLLTPPSFSFAVPDSENIKQWNMHRIVIPHYFVEYRVPSNLTPGSGGWDGPRTEVVFHEPEKEHGFFKFGAYGYQTDFATFYQGAKGNLVDWDMAFRFFILKFNDGNLVRNSLELKRIVQEELSKKMRLKNGRDFTDFGTATVEKIRDGDVVVAEAADLYHTSSIELANGEVVEGSPYQIYYIRLDDRIVFGLRVFHENPQKLTPKWHADARELAKSILGSLKITPRDEDSPSR